MFCRDVIDNGSSSEYVLARSGFSNAYLEALNRVCTKEYFINSDMVKEFCAVGINRNVDVSTIDMDNKSIIITFNLSENRSVEVLVAKYWWCEYTYIDAYCRVINELTNNEKFFVLPINKCFPSRFSGHKALHIDSGEKLDIWKVLIHAIMSDIDVLFEERNGVLVSKSVNLSNLDIFEQFVSGHFKRVRYGRGRKKTRTKYVKSYWRGDGTW